MLNALCVSFAVLAAGCSQRDGAVGIDYAGLSPKTYKALRFSSTIRQEQDFTCGSAALATILTHYWGRTTSENEILKILADRYPNQNEWKARVEAGFSFDDLSFAAMVLGFESAGAKVPVSELESLNGPVIVHLDKGKFQHFSVLRKAKDGVFYLADPTVGQTGLQRGEFEAQYTGNAMAIWKAGTPIPANSPLAVVRDGLSTYSSFGQINRTVPIQRALTF
jgi:uncharacterized protein